MNPLSGDDHCEMGKTVGSGFLSPMTIARFLIGNREAIQQVANCPHALRLGLVFVISAGFAREYDGESLLHEPWHVLLPLGASLITSYVLFSMVSFVALRRGANTFRTSGAYRSFLGLFWMTAPLAWLYAIPVERFMSTGNATAANMWLLGIVAVWRVVLIIRVIRVVFGARTMFDVVSTVMLFADTVTQIAVFTMPTPIWMIMGGVRLTESEQIILGVTCNLKLWGILSFPVWLIGYAWACRKQPSWNPTIGSGAATVEVGRLSWGLAIASLLIWTPVLPWTQPEQILRHQVDRDLAAERVDDALRRMSNHEREDFPPHWDPLPRPNYGIVAPDLYLIMESIASNPDYSPWVRELYVQKFFTLRRKRQFEYLLRNGKPGDLEKATDLIERIPEARRAFADDHREDALGVIEDDTVPPSLQERVRVLADLPEPSEQEPKPPTNSRP